MDFSNFIYDRFGHKKPSYKISEIEKNYFKALNTKMEDKSLNRIYNIKLRIKNDLDKNSFPKKYQIKSMSEYKIIKKFCETLDMKGYELLWCNDENGLKMNKLDKIIEGDYDCCKECDRPMIFINKKVPIIYCYFYKK
jgi:hypothetical protein